MAVLALGRQPTLPGAPTADCWSRRATAKQSCSLEFEEWDSTRFDTVPRGYPIGAHVRYSEIGTN